MVIVSTAYGNELRGLVFESYDFEVGEEENSFEVVIRRGDWEDIPERGRIYIPGTEYGGIYTRLGTVTAQGTISPGGKTWRGMLMDKIISPPTGEDYAYASGELNAVLKTYIEAAFPGLFVVSTEDTGVSVNYQFERYCTLYDGLRDALESVGYRLAIAYNQTLSAVVAQAVPIVNYAEDIELSSNLRANYSINIQNDRVNHLICLGSGELAARIVRHLYVNAKGRITTTQTFFGVEEVAAVYDYAGATAADLVSGGKKRLRELRNQNRFDMTIDPEMDIAIGDIVGGRDYLSGVAMQAPVKGKIMKWERGFERLEYILDTAEVITI